MQLTILATWWRASDSDGEGQKVSEAWQRISCEFEEQTQPFWKWLREVVLLANWIQFKDMLSCQFCKDALCTACTLLILTSFRQFNGVRWSLSPCLNFVLGTVFEVRENIIKKLVQTDHLYDESEISNAKPRVSQKWNTWCSMLQPWICQWKTIIQTGKKTPMFTQNIMEHVFDDECLKQLRNH